MSALALCTDSSALFPPGVAERLGVSVVPISITLDGATFEERDDAIDDFYTCLSGGAQVTTSQPSAGDFLEAYAHAAGTGAEEVLSIHLDARISGTLGSAELAARDAPIPATVVDTKTASFGVGHCVRAAADAIAAGASAAEAASAAGRVGETLRNVFVANAGPRGRLPEVSSWSLLEFAGGKVVPGAAASEGLSQAIEAMAARVFHENGPLRAAVGHCAASTEPAADALAFSLASMSHVIEVERYRVGAAVGAHTGGLSFGASGGRRRRLAPSPSRNAGESELDRLDDRGPHCECPARETPQQNAPTVGRASRWLRTAVDPSPAQATRRRLGAVASAVWTPFLEFLEAAPGRAG